MLTQSRIPGLTPTKFRRSDPNEVPSFRQLGCGIPGRCLGEFDLCFLFWHRADAVKLLKDEIVTIQIARLRERPTKP
jgi:hypothetical protein